MNVLIMSAGVVRYSSLHNVLTKVTNTTNFGGQSQWRPPTQIIERDASTPSPGMAAHAYDQNSKQPKTAR